MLAWSFVLCLCCPGRSTFVHWQCCWAWQLDVTAERDPLHQGLIVERAKLKPRGYQLDLSSRLGKTQVVTNSTPLNQQVGLHIMTAILDCPPCCMLQIVSMLHSVCLPIASLWRSVLSHSSSLPISVCEASVCNNENTLHNKCSWHVVMMVLRLTLFLFSVTGWILLQCMWMHFARFTVISGPHQWQIP